MELEIACHDHLLYNKPGNPASEASVPKRDDYFDHNFQPGIISKRIFEARTERNEPLPDPAALIERFVSMNRAGLAEMVRYLCTKKGSMLDSFGSGSLIPEGQDPRTPFSIEAAMNLRELYIGSKRHHLTPLAWMGYFARFADALPQDVLEVVELLCKLTVSIESGSIKTEPVVER
jgi:hypothetical protein